MSLKNAVEEEKAFYARMWEGKKDRVENLYKETKWWFNHSSELFSQGDEKGASDAYDVYLNLSNELKEVLFG